MTAIAAAWPSGAPAPAGLLTMASPLAAVLRRALVVVPPDAPVRQALLDMERTRAAAAVVTDQAGIPLGLFTLRDLLRRVTLPGGDLAQPVAAVMTAGLITLGPQATAHHAALTMARHRVGRVVVVDGAGRLLGLVSQGDLFGQRVLGVQEVSEKLEAARDLGGLREAAGAVRAVADSLVVQGLAAEALTHLVSTLNDLLTIRILELCADAHDLPPVPMCWVAMGSEGRMEQTFATDQDNAIVFEAPPSEAAAVREGLLPFAATANRWLAECGFPLCKGKVMASNPAWCLSLGEWRSAFAAWSREPTAPALLRAATALDLRPIHGSEGLVERLREAMLAEVGPGSLLVRHLGEVALEARPPLGRIRDFVTDRGPDFPGTLDLKGSGSRLFVDAARTLALAHGVAQTSTAERLRSVAEAVRLSPEELAALLDAFHFVHRLRLRHQLRARGGEAANRIDPRALHELDRHLLRESLRQAAWLQRHVATELALG